jgi:hypothetical protein
MYLGEGCSSLFVYGTPVLHLSEHGPEKIISGDIRSNCANGHAIIIASITADFRYAARTLLAAGVARVRHRSGRCAARGMTG